MDCFLIQSKRYRICNLCNAQEKRCAYIVIRQALKQISSVNIITNYTIYLQTVWNKLIKVSDDLQSAAVRRKNQRVK